MKHSPYIDLSDSKDIYYWTQKWDISQTELYSAILDTGSNNVDILKENLRNKGMFLFPMGKLMHDLLAKVKLVH
ncbi:MAG: hypothetical protein V4590_06465 [Bacteroidota bacterium]